MADVELQEQSVPLKTAEQSTEGAETTAAGAEGAKTEQKATVVTKEKKSWFKKKPAKPEGGEAAITEGGDGDANNVSEKKEKGAKGGAAKPKCPFSFCRAQKVEGQAGAEQGQQQPSFQVDMVQRDPAKLQESIDLGVEHVFGEPDAVHSVAGVWRVTLRVFLAVRAFCYKLFSLLFAIPLAILFGILFAVASALSVFVLVPVARLLAIPFGWVAKLWSVLISAACDPLCRSLSLLFGNVKVSRYGINQDPTAVLSA